jgi:acyl-CoA synthetase (AMP-forming)/AMP-acid ligase II
MLTWPDRSLPAGLVAALTGPGAPFEVATEEVLGARMEVFRNRPRTFVEILRGGAERFADRPYIVFPDRSLTFASIIDPVAAVAHSFQEKYGIGPGDRVAVASANRLEFVLSYWAATCLGAVTVALNSWWTAHEMAYALGLTEPKLLLGDERRLQRLAGAAPPGLPVVSFEDDFAGMEAAGAGAPLPEVDIAEDDPYVILFTSGTTGRPKGAVISHRSNIHFGLATQLRGAEAAARSVAAGRPLPEPYVPCSVNAAPMFHVAGLTCTLALAPLNGLTMVYPPPGRWSEETQLRLTHEHRATAWTLVPTQLWRLLDWPSLPAYDLSSLRTIGGGSAVWPPELLRRLEATIPWVRPGLSLGYGMTETNGLGTSLASDRTYSHPDSIGQAGPTVQVEIRDPLTRAAVPDGEVGEIALRTAGSFVGYWRNPEATAGAVDRDRWYHTGDYGHIRDGFVYLEGRRHDLIIRGGENIYPVEIENRLFEHPGIAEAAVVGVDHPTLGQEVKAFVVTKTGTVLTEDQVKGWCRATLAGFKVPAQVDFPAELPHNAAGKVVKHLLGRPQVPSDFIQE